MWKGGEVNAQVWWGLIRGASYAKVFVRFGPCPAGAAGLGRVYTSAVRPIRKTAVCRIPTCAVAVGLTPLVGLVLRAGPPVVALPPERAVRARGLAERRAPEPCIAETFTSVRAVTIVFERIAHPVHVYFIAVVERTPIRNI